MTEERTILDQIKDELKQWNIASMQSEAVAMSELMLGMIEQMEESHDPEDEIVEHMVSTCRVFGEYAESFIAQFGPNRLRKRPARAGQDSDCMCSHTYPVHGNFYVHLQWRGEEHDGDAEEPDHQD